MQALPLPAPSQSHSSFHRHQLEVNSKWLFDLEALKVGRESVGALLPSPPMSRSPPQQITRDPAQVAGIRRKRSESPAASPAATTSVTYPPPPLSGRLPTWPEPPQSPFSRPAGGHFAPQLQSSYPPPPPPLLGQPAFNIQGPPGAPGVQDISLGLTSALGQGPSRATRKPKAHVASACVNCKKKHLRCDNARPCRRCVQAGKEESCVDVTHKKRGRPPLKADDPQTRRTFAASPSALPPQHSRVSSSPVLLERPLYPPDRSPTSFRDLRPLQSPRQESLGRPRDPLQPPPQPLTTFSTALAGQGQISPYGPPRLSGHRPFSSTSSTASSAQPPSPYFPSPGLPPGVGLTPPFETHSRSISTSAMTSFSQPQIVPTIPPIPTSRPLGHQAYRPLHPQPVGSAEASMATLPRSRPPSRSITASQGLPELQLPPIRPVPLTPRPSEATAQVASTNTSPSQASAPALETRLSTSDQTGMQGGGYDSIEARDSKRQRMDLGGMLGPGHE